MNVPGPRALLAVALLTASVAGCGIRTNDVPVDGGPAPTRATCEVAAEDGSGAEVFLLCGSRVESVPRAVELRGSDPGLIAGRLLAELQSDPAKEERAAGFETEVPADLEVSSPPGETVGTGADALPVLRLSRGPGDLPLSALFQIVCTFSHSESLGTGQSVVLGGPPGSSTETPKEYPCTAAARTIPGEGVTPPGQGQGQAQEQAEEDAVVEDTVAGEAGQDPTG